MGIPAARFFLMKPTRELIAAIRKACPRGKDETDWIAEQLDEVRRIGADISADGEVRRRIAEEARQRTAEADKKLAAIHKRCRHWTITRHGDPSGGSDSYYECDICGKDLGK